MALDNYDPSTALSAYYPTRAERRPARLWATEKLLHDMAELGMVQFFEGPGTDPTGISGYAIDKLWLRVSSGVTDEPGEVRAYAGSGDATLLASWPLLTPAAALGFFGATAAGVAMVTAANEAAQTALLDAFTGDSGSGGVKGLVPAPAAGDAAASKFLSASGGWGVIPAGDVTTVADYTALKALSGTETAIVTDTNKGGVFPWRVGDFTAEVAADPLEGIYVPSDADPTGAAGCRVRQGGWAVEGADARWFGYTADYNSTTGAGTENGAIIEAALAVPTVSKVICPVGMAKVDSLEIPKNKVVRGVRPTYQTFLNSTAKPDDYTDGTVWCTRVAGTMVSSRPTNETVRLNQWSGLENVMIFHDGQDTPGLGWAPTDTPWAVRAGRFADNSRDVRAEHAYMSGVVILAYSHAIEFQKGGEAGYIRDCAWHAFKIGLSLDNIHHIIMLDNVEAYPYWSADDSIRLYMTNNYEAYEFGRVDGLRVKGGLFSIWTNIGVNFIPSRSTDFPGQPAYFFDIDAIYSDSCTHGLMVSPSISGAPLTGHIGSMVVQRSGFAGLTVTAGNDYGVRLRGLCDISIDKFEGSGSGYSRPGGHMNATASGANISIGQARICDWNSDASGAVAFSFGTAGTSLHVGDIKIHNGTAEIAPGTKRVFQGVTASGEDNISTGKRLYIDGIGTAANRAVTINSSDQTLVASHPIKLVTAGYREFRVRGRVGTHATNTNVAVKSGGNAGITNTLVCTASGTTLDVDSGWLNINLSPSSENEFGALLANGVPGDASLTFLRLGMEFR